MEMNEVFKFTTIYYVQRNYDSFCIMPVDADSGGTIERESENVAERVF